MSSFEPTVLRPMFETYHASRAMEPLARLPSAPDIAFGAFSLDAPDEAVEQGSLLLSVETAGDAYRMVSLGAAPGEWAIKAERAYRWRRPAGSFRAVCV